uniref:Uncharacterized protein n=1 Tax=Chenopodium quinoa TaxID=63459 RepID=A0A803M8C9_CHEQI
MAVVVAMVAVMVVLVLWRLGFSGKSLSEGEQMDLLAIHGNRLPWNKKFEGFDLGFGESYGANWIASLASTELEAIVMDWMGKLLLPQQFLFYGGGGGVMHGSTCEAVVCTKAASRDCALDTHGSGVVNPINGLGRIAKEFGAWLHVRVERPEVASFAVRMESRPKPRLSRAERAALTCTHCQKTGHDSSTCFDLHGTPTWYVEKYGTSSLNSKPAEKGKIGASTVSKGKGNVKANATPMPQHTEPQTAGTAANPRQTDPDRKEAAAEAAQPQLQQQQPTIETATNPRCTALDRSHIAEVSAQPHHQGQQHPSTSLNDPNLIRRYGSDNLMAHIRSDIELAKHLESLIQKDKQLELIVPRKFSLVCFRIKQVTNDGNLNVINQTLLEVVNLSGQAYMTHAVIGGKFAIRCVIGGSMTQKCHIDSLWKLIQETARSIIFKNGWKTI